MDGHELLDYLVEQNNPWLRNIEPAPGFKPALVRLYARDVIQGRWTLEEAHAALDAMEG